MAWEWMANWTVGHGYNRWLVLVWLAGFWIVGVLVFGQGGGFRMQPASPLAMREIESAKTHEVAAAKGGVAIAPGYPRFRPVMYSLDTLLPLVEFDQSQYWIPRTDPVAGRWWVASGYRWTRLYLALHIAAGWGFATLFAMSFTRVMRTG